MVEERQRAALADLEATAGDTLADLSRAFWQQLTEAAIWPVRGHVRLTLAFGRGLLLGLLTTRDRAGVQEAYENFIARLEKRTPRPRALGPVTYESAVPVFPEADPALIARLGLTLGPSIT